MKKSSYDTAISELKGLKKLLVNIYGKSHDTVKKIDRICSVYYGIDMYINKKNRLNLLVLGEVSSNFNHSFLNRFFPAGISEIFLKRCENGINKVVFNNVSTYDQIYIALEKEKMLSEDKHLFLENMFELLNQDINLIPEDEENLYKLENNMGLLNFNDHMESIMFGDFNERFSVFYENFLIEKLFITRNFGSDSRILSKPINKLLWIPNAAVGVDNHEELNRITKFIEDTLGLNYYTFVCDYTGEKFIPTIVEQNNQNLIRRIGEDKRVFIDELIANRCFFDERIEFKRGKALILDFLTEETEGKLKFRRENAFDITENDISTINRFFSEDDDKLHREVEAYLKRDISELNLRVENIQNEMAAVEENPKTDEIKILEIFEFLKSMMIIVTDLFDESANRMDIFTDLRQYLTEFESENKLSLFDPKALDDLEVHLSEENLYQMPEKILELGKRIFKMFEDILLKCKIEIKAIQRHQKESASKINNSEAAANELFEYIKGFILKENDF